MIGEGMRRGLFSAGRLLQLRENSVEGDRVSSDGGGIGTSGKFRERARARGLLKNLHLAVVHCRAGRENVVVTGQSVHPHSALNRGLRGCDGWKLRKIERV